MGQSGTIDKAATAAGRLILDAMGEERPARSLARLSDSPRAVRLLRELFAKDAAAAARRLIHVPMGRFARAEEIAAAALFLASDESSYVNASTFLVDGGLSSAYVTPE